MKTPESIGADPYQSHPCVLWWTCGQSKVLVIACYGQVSGCFYMPLPAPSGVAQASGVIDNQCNLHAGFAAGASGASQTGNEGQVPQAAFPAPGATPAFTLGAASNEPRPTSAAAGRRRVTVKRRQR